jgi:AcrR family transcriptional regulator
MPGETSSASGERVVKRRMPAAQRRALILDCARETFLEAGESSAVSLRTIAQRSGIDEALIYRHFGTKERLYVEAISDPVTAVIAEFASNVRSAGLESQPADRVRREWDLTHQFFVRLLTLPPKITRAMGMLLFGNPIQARAFYADVLAPALTALEDLVEAEKGNWEHAPFSSAIAVRMTLASGFWLVSEYEIASEVVDIDAVAAELTDRLIYGMAARV